MRRAFFVDRSRPPVVARDARQLGEFGDPVHQLGHFLSEILADDLEGDGGVFDDVMQKAGGDGRPGEVEVRQNLGDRQAVLNIGFAGGADLALMTAERHLIRPLDHLAVLGGKIREGLGKRLIIHRKKF